MTNLKPCPFCGSKRITNGAIRDGWSYVCFDCKGEMTAYNPNAKNKALEKWNTRYTPPEDRPPELPENYHDQ